MLEDIIRIKLILLGDAGVGKSSIIKRYYEDKFEEIIDSTSSSHFFEKEVIINSQNAILELWDTAGQEIFRSVNQIFVKNSRIIILVYDITSNKSFESLNYWYDFIVKELGPNVILGLAGNKTDLIFDDNYEEEVTPERGKLFAEKIGASFSCISAKESSYEIQALFNELLSRYLHLKQNNKYLSGSIKLDESSFTREIDSNSDCCLGKNKKSHKLLSIFLGSNGIGKTRIIKAIKGKEDINNLVHTKNEYKEYIHYKRNNQYITVEWIEVTTIKYINEYIESHNGHYKIFFLVFDIHRKETLYDLEKYIKKIDIIKNKVYLLGYDNNSSIFKNNEFNFMDEVEKFEKNYGIEYEYITLEDIYKIKTIIIDNIGIYFSNLGY